jgi:hypothetical protein
MKKSLFFYTLIILLHQYCAFAQAFEGKLTYIFEHGKNLDTNFVWVRGDSIRIDLSKRNNVSTYLYFAGKNEYHYYSKRDETYFSYPIVKPDGNKKVISYQLNSESDSMTLHYEAKTLSTSFETNVETTSKVDLKLDSKLRVSFWKDIYVEPYVLNGSGYIANEINIEYHFGGVDEKRVNRRRLIEVNATKPNITLFSLKRPPSP